MTRFSVYLKSIRTSKYALFEIKIFRNSYFASCTKISVSKITCYTVYNTRAYCPTGLGAWYFMLYACMYFFYITTPVIPVLITVFIVFQVTRIFHPMMKNSNCNTEHDRCFTFWHADLYIHKLFVLIYRF